ALDLFRPIRREKIKMISVFGSARTPKSDPQYKMVCRLGEQLYRAGFAVVTGASQGVMEAANEGVSHGIIKQLLKGKKGVGSSRLAHSPAYKKLLSRYSAGLKISLPMEPDANPYIGVSAIFHYFMIRKFFFATLSSGFIACEGGWGTRDELFEILTLVQTGKAPLMPIVYLSRKPDHLLHDFRSVVKNKFVSAGDLRLIEFVKTPEAAVRAIQKFYRVVDRVEHKKQGDIWIELKKSVPSTKRRAVEREIKRSKASVDEVVWTGKSLTLKRYRPKSFGDLRKIVDLLNF
ncbi:MAG: LOG family protein, partial [bacterium]|nr:LOG family protein [bacterium]